MKKVSLSITSIFLLIMSGCNDNSSIISPDQNISSNSFVFVAGEGNFYMPNSGSISYIDDYGNVNVLENIAIRNELTKYSNWPTIPQLFCDGELIGGCDITVELHHSGELKDILKK